MAPVNGTGIQGASNSPTVDISAQSASDDVSLYSSARSCSELKRLTKMRDVIAIWQCRGDQNILFPVFGHAEKWCQKRSAMSKEQKEGSTIHTGDEPGSATILRIPSASLIFRAIVEMILAEYGTEEEDQSMRRR